MEISKKIVSQRVVTDAISENNTHQQVFCKLEEELFTAPKAAGLKRPKVLGDAAVYRIKPPHYEHALYMTVAPTIVNGHKYLYEVFFHSKDIKHRQWTDTLTLSWSNTFRLSVEHGFSLSSFIKNLQDTESYDGVYRVRLRESDNKPTLVKGLISEIGYHLGQFVVDCAGYNADFDNYIEVKADVFEEDSQYDGDALVAHHIDSAKECSICANFSVVFENGCEVCKSCGDSKCG